LSIFKARLLFAFFVFSKKVFFCAANGYGTLTLTKNALTVTMLEDMLPVDKLVLTIGGKTKTLIANLTASVGRPAVVKMRVPCHCR
jgi:hypothetical protein